MGELPVSPGTCERKSGSIPKCGTTEPTSIFVFCHFSAATIPSRCLSSDFQPHRTHGKATAPRLCSLRRRDSRSAVAHRVGSSLWIQFQIRSPHTSVGSLSINVTLSIRLITSSGHPTRRPCHAVNAKTRTSPSITTRNNDNLRHSLSSRVSVITAADNRGQTA